MLDIGDRVLSMKLSHGGHLSHGATASITSRCFDFSHYGLSSKTERIDYNAVASLAKERQPRMIVAGASSYPRLIDYGRLADIAAGVSAYFMVDMAHIAGLVAAEAIPSPVPYADLVTFTTYKTLMGGRGGVILCKRPHAARIDRSVFPGCQGTPAMNMIAAKAVCFLETGAATAGRIVADWYAEPMPAVALEPPLEETAHEKREFERDRLQRWFGAAPGIG